jgi:hypothetical protein
MGVVTLVGVLANPGARAEAAAVLLLRPARAAPLATEALVRLRGELAAAGFQVDVADVPAGPDAQAAIDQAAAVANVEALVAILGDPGRETAEIRIVDRVRGETIRRQVLVPPGSERRAELLAIRTLELLRASILEVALGTTAPARAAPTTPANASVAPDRTVKSPASVAAKPAREPARWRESVFALELGGVVLGSLRGMGPAFVPLIRAEARLGGRRGRWMGRLTLAGLGTKARVASGDEAAEVAHSFGLIEVVLPFRAGARVQPFLSLGAGGERVTAEGRTSWLYQGAHDGLWAALVGAGAGLRVGLSGRLQLAGELHVQGAYPYAVVRFLGTTLAEEGRPTLVAGLSVIAWL